MDSPTSITDQTPKEKPTVISSPSNKKVMFKFSLVNPKILGAMTVFLLLIGGVGTGVYLIQNPQQTTSQASLPSVELNFQPPEVQTNISSEFNVDVFASAGENKINSIDLSFKYDSELLTLKSITPGQFLPRILMNPSIEPGTASISLGTDSNSGVTDSGIVASLVFEAKAGSDQPTQITLDPQGTKIKALNRASDGSSDILGKVDVIISASEILETSTLDTQPADTSDSENVDNPSTSDFNEDGLINSIDLSVMYAGWGDPESEMQQKADLNNDSKINGIDYSLFLPQFKK